MKSAKIKEVRNTAAMKDASGIMNVARSICEMLKSFSKFFSGRVFMRSTASISMNAVVVRNWAAGWKDSVWSETAAAGTEISIQL